MKGKILLGGGVALIAAIAYMDHVNSTTTLPTMAPVPGTPTPYLATRTGAELERTLQNVIAQTHQRCDRVRGVSSMEPEVLKAVRAADGHWVDCGDDGVYGVLEVPEGFKAIRR